MRLLILTFSYAPKPNARAIRWTALAEELVRRGHHVSVITAWQPDQPVDETLGGVRVFRVGSRLMERLRKRLAAGRTRASVVTGSSTTHAAREGAVTRLLGVLNHTLWSKLWWPDSSCVWLGSATRKARDLLRSALADAVISVSPTFTAVLAGYALAANKRLCNKWVIDLGDPFSFMNQAPPNNFRLYGALNRWFERRAFRRADAISVTNQTTQKLYADLYAESAPKIAVIPPLLSAQTHPAGSTHALFFKNSTAIKLVYLGTLYRGLRRPDFLLQLFLESAIPDCELHFIGDIHECRDTIGEYAVRAGGTRIAVHEPVGREEAVRATREADVLINLGNDTVFQLPSKLVEYAAAGKRIVSISRAAHDSSAQFLRTYPLALCLYDDGRRPSPDQVREFTAFCAAASSDTISPDALEEFLRAYRIDRVVEQYEKLIRS